LGIRWRVGLFLHKCQRVEGFFNEYKRMEGFKGKTPCLRPPHAARNRGGGKIGAAALGGAWPATPGPRRRLEVGEIGRGGAGDRFPPSIWGVAARRGGATAVGGGRLWCSRWRRHRTRRRPGLGEKGEGSLGGSSAYLGLSWGVAGRGTPRWPEFEVAAMAGGGWNVELEERRGLASSVMAWGAALGCLL